MYEIPEEIRKRLRNARSAVAFSGAGVSKESGLDTFRGAGGLWERMRPEELATPEAFDADPGMVWRWYAWRHSAATAAEPNPAHRALVRWEELFPSFTLVTQNVDGLHARAGSTAVLELHGTLIEAKCERCGLRRAVPAGGGLVRRVARSGRARPGAPGGGGLRSLPLRRHLVDRLPGGGADRDGLSQRRLRHRGQSR